VLGGLVRQRGHVQAAERDEDSLRAIRVCERIGPRRARDVDLDGDEIGAIGGVDALDMLVDDDGLVVRPEVPGKRREAERRKERVLDRPPVRAGRFRQGRQDELHTEAPH
jgi:hypothetical protein